VTIHLFLAVLHCIDIPQTFFFVFNPQKPHSTFNLNCLTNSIPPWHS